MPGQLLIGNETGSEPRSRRMMAIAAGWSLLAFMLLPVLAYVPPLFGLRDYVGHLSVHTYAEAFACAVSVLIFGICWYAALAERSVRMAIIATAFLSVALLDFAYLLSYQGVPSPVAPGGPERPIALWLAARYAQAVGLLGIILVPGGWRIGQRGPQMFIIASLAFTTAVFWVVLANPDSLPRTLLPDIGTTSAKVAAEYGVMALLVVTAAGLLACEPRKLDFPVPVLFAAVIVLLASELALTLYAEVDDNYSFIGYIYKVVAYWLIFRAFFVTAVTQPYRDRAAAERLYHRLTERAADAIWLLDRDGRIVSANPRAQQLTGRPVAGLVGRKLSDFLAGNNGEPFAQRSSATLGGTDRFEAGLTGQDGGSLPVEISISPLDNGGSLAIARDITERKRSETEIRIRDISFASTMTPIAIANIDRTLSYANRAFLDLWGYDSESELLGQDMRVVFADPAQADEAARALRETGSWNTEFRGRRRDGAVIDVLVNSNMVSDDSGIPICMIGSCTDITERKQIEQERQRWADAFVHAAYGIAITDTATNTQISVNPAYAAMHGMTVAEMIGFEVRTLYAPETFDIRVAAVRASDSTGHSEFDAARLRKDGSRFPARIWLTTVSGGTGQPLYRIATVIDLTERKSIEDQLAQAQKMEAIGNLTGGMAHDFNNLISIIILNLESLAVMLPDNEQATTLISDSLTAALSGAGLTQGLLAFARRQTLAPSVVSITDLVAGMVTLLRRTLGETIVVTLELAPDLWPVLVDPVQLQASLLNLAVNARDAMPKGGRLLIATGNKQIDAGHADIHPELAPGDYATITVTDDGAGMPDAIKEHIFEPFYTTKNHAQRSGLGLSMVFGFLRQSNGLITVYSEEGNGTTFRLYLPRSTAEAERTTRPVAVAPTDGEFGGGGETILVVEDNELLRNSVVRQLTMFGYHVLQAADGGQALTVLETHEVQLALSDIVMPGAADGIALAREIMARWPNTKVVLASGFTEAKINADDPELTSSVRFLHKPFRRDELAQVIRDTLDE